MNYLKHLCSIIDAVNDWVGRSVSWLTVGMVILTFLIVVLRYGFQMGWVWLQESVQYAHVLVFLCAAGYGFKQDKHVRIDVIYRKLSDRAQAVINLLGVLFLLWPTCGVIFLESWFYVVNSWSVWEGSRNVGGIDAVFLLKTVILVFSGLLFLQGISVMGQSLKRIGSSNHA